MELRLPPFAPCIRRSPAAKPPRIRRGSPAGRWSTARSATRFWSRRSRRHSIVRVRRGANGLSTGAAGGAPRLCRPLPRHRCRQQPARHRGAERRRPTRWPQCMRSARSGRCSPTRASRRRRSRWRLTTRKGTRDPPIRVSYLRYVAQPPQCGDWSTNLAYEPMNLPYPNFGCAGQHNFGAMVANPADLLGPRSETARSSERRDQVWSKYVRGSRRALPKSARRAREQGQQQLRLER